MKEQGMSFLPFTGGMSAPLTSASLTADNGCPLQIVLVSKQDTHIELQGDFFFGNYLSCILHSFVADVMEESQNGQMLAAPPCCKTQRV